MLRNESLEFYKGFQIHHKKEKSPEYFAGVLMESTGRSSFPHPQIHDLELWFSNSREHQIPQEGLLKPDCWAPHPDF